MRHILTKFPPKSLINRLLSPPPPLPPPSQLSLSSRFLSTTTEPKPKPGKLDRIADELLSLNAVELHDYSILFGLKMGLKNAGPAALGAGPGTSGKAGAAAAPEAAEKTSFDLKLVSYESGAKLKIVKEVRTITGLGLKEAKDLVEKFPSCIKTGVTKEEGKALVAALQLLGATVSLE